MTKLKFKRTEEEEAEHQARKERRREKKRKRERAQSSSSSKRHHADEHSEHPSRKWASSDEDGIEESIPQGTDYAFLKAEIEERRFREKMFDALGDDERLDGIGARFNDFVHLPMHWQHASTSGFEKAKTTHVCGGDEYLKLDPNAMDDEEYAEWIRKGMYRKTHAEEYAEQQRKSAENAARKAEEKVQKAETKRAEKLAEEERKWKETEHRLRRFEEARGEYNLRWAELLASLSEIGDGELAFHDIPWPVVAAYRRRRSEGGKQQFGLADLTAEAVSSFLLPELRSEVENTKKDRLRDAIRRFHPDKFEGRFINRVKGEDKEIILEGIGQVSRVLNSLLSA